MTLKTGAAYEQGRALGMSEAEAWQRATLRTLAAGTVSK